MQKQINGKLKRKRIGNRISYLKRGCAHLFMKISKFVVLSDLTSMGMA